MAKSREVVLKSTKQSPVKSFVENALDSNYTVSVTHLVPIIDIFKMPHRKLSKEFILPDIKSLPTIQVTIPQSHYGYQHSINKSKDNLKEFLTDNKAKTKQHKRSMSYVFLNVKEVKRPICKNVFTSQKENMLKKIVLRANSIESLNMDHNKQGRHPIPTSSFKALLRERIPLMKSRLGDPLKRRNKSIYQSQQYLGTRHPFKFRFALYSQKTQLSISNNTSGKIKSTKLNKFKFSIIEKVMQEKSKLKDIANLLRPLNYQPHEEVKLVPKLTAKWIGTPILAIYDIIIPFSYI